VAAIDGDLSTRQAARRFAIGIATAGSWHRLWRRTGDVRPSRQGKPSRSKLDAHEGFILRLIEQRRDIALAEIAAHLAETRGVSACPATIWYFLEKRGLTYKIKTAHAAEQQRADVKAARRAWFERQTDLHPGTLVFIDETGATTNVAGSRAVTVGNGRDPGVRMGPLANAHRLAAMERLTADAVTRGSRLLCGGGRIGNRGFFFAPTVLADVAEDAAIMNEEPFGPIAPMAPFDDVDEALARANRLPLAFAAYVFSDSVSFTARIAGGLTAGNIGVNQMAPSLPDAPIGGLADSGVGYEGGRRGIEAFTHVVLVSRD
jgi:transposase